MKYSVDFTGSGISNGYVNVRFTGLDGEKLYYKGIGYSKRTYDINNNVQTDGTLSSGHIAYYPVPNGCTDYMLVCETGQKKQPAAHLMHITGLQNKRQHGKSTGSK